MLTLVVLKERRKPLFNLRSLYSIKKGNQKIQYLHKLLKNQKKKIFNDFKQLINKQSKVSYSTLLSIHTFFINHFNNFKNT